MKEIYSFEYERYSDLKELSDKRKKVLKEAEKALAHAYSPYSKFSVGAALLLNDGNIIHGSNQENRAYPSGLCAERVALFSYGAGNSNEKIEKLGIVSSGKLLNKSDLLTPCGACRQVMAEFAYRQDSDFEILMKNADGSILVFKGISQLLPFTFGSEQ
ncbi:MAG: cytidine deaminase [Brumimicrobium sp.]|nr:cytidine deaminase [Brumimicrobium sp.]